MGDNNLKESNSQMQLIVIDRFGELQYYDKFRLRLHGINEQLIIMPSHNEDEFIHITFKRNFVHQNLFQQIICIDECETDSHKYLLIFITAEKCIRFIDSVKNSKAKRKLLFNVSMNDEIFQSKFFTPIAKKCQENPLMNEKLKTFLFKFFEYYKLFNEKEVNTLQDHDGAVSNYAPNESSYSDVTQNISKTENEIFKDQKTETTNKSKERCHRKRPYNKNKKISQRHALLEAQQERSVCRTQGGGEGGIPAKYLNCLIYSFIEPPKYKKVTPTNVNIYAPNFKLFHFIKNGKFTTRLCIFASSDKTMCYDYFVHSKRYKCSGCSNVRKPIYAIIVKDSNGVDYVKCLQTEHFCEARKFFPENYQSDLIIKKPNYEIIEEIVNGKVVKYLLLYTSEDKTTFYKLTFCKLSFICMRCDKARRDNGCSRKRISATIREDENGNEVVFVRNLKHLCSNMNYFGCEEATTVMKLSNISVQNINQSEQSQTSMLSRISLEIIKKPNYELFQRKVYGRTLQKLAIFDSNDITMCYELTWSNRYEYYVCHQCKNYFNKHVYAKVINVSEEKEEEYVQLGKCNHKCEMKKFLL